MWEQIIQWDKDLLVFLNGLGNETWDFFWLYITKQLNWWPLFLVILYLLYRKLPLKQLILLLLTLTLFFVFTDQMTNLVKNTVQRYRPVNDPELTDVIRNVKGSASWSYFSGHASNSLGAIFIIFMAMKNYYKKAWLLFLFPLIFAYTRLYLGLHFPLDILSGYLFGLLSGYLFFRLYVYVCNRYV
ncbi:phosphatase PAP2 family protein [Avrilella dinanensis]|uniref:Phosphatase PAP2 family protein n=1 Tax=Avrilella dinanensis TaxID=2008672 RepID=A0A2M9R4Q0_9FLAO|nr:phosphatase PAP2 family protein [Avrilella dinanensis]PJR03703.1 phosphatase PAP2 family protein [Avrilella dinanensis]